MSGFNLSEENFDDYSEVAEGVWTVSERHKASGAAFLPDINNRGFIYRVRNKSGEDHLLMVGIPKDHCIPKVKKLETATGLKLTLIVGQGDFHHMSIKDWLTEWPEVRLIQSGIKFPKTRNGAEILENENFKSRITLLETPDFSMLKEYEDQLQFFGFDQFFVYSDQPWMSKDAKVQTKESMFGFLAKFGNTKADQRFLAVWTYHVPTKQLIYEHNFDVYFAKETLKQFPFMMQMMMSAEHFGSTAKGPMPKGPTSEEGCRIHCEQMAKIVDLDVRAAVDYHTLPGQMVRKWTSKEAFRTEFLKVLAETGEHDPTGQTMTLFMNPGCCTVS